MSTPYPKHRNVFRIETGNTVGWQVRIERNKKQHNKFFSDSHYNGADGGLAAALAWRDSMLAQLPKHQYRTQHLHTRVNRKKAAKALNQTGVIGIGFSMHTQRSGTRTPYISCHWRDPDTGDRRSTSYSINKHGLRQALRLACRRLREGRGDEVTQGKVDYMVRKAYPAVKKLHDEAVN